MNPLKAIFADNSADRGYRAHVLADAAVSGKADGRPVMLSMTDPVSWPSEPVAAGVPVNDSSVLALSSAWACVNLLAGLGASLPLMVYRPAKGGSYEEYREHPLYRLLAEAPNYDQTAYDFWEGGLAGLELRGNMHARKVYSGSRLIALNPIANASARREPGGAIRYRWTENGRSYDEGQESVLHIRGFGGSPLSGLSTLAYGRQVFGLTSAVNTAAAKNFANGARPSLALSTDKFLNEKRAIIEKGIEEKHAGAMNAGRPLILEGGLTPHNLSFSPEDAQMLESRGFGVEEVCRLFGVPPHLIGHTSGNTSLGSSISDQTLSFVKFNFARRLTRNRQSLQMQLLTPADRAAGVIIDYVLDGLLALDAEGRSEFYKNMTGMGAFTINEVRKKENMPPIEGGDVPRVQMQNMPINMTASPQIVAGGSQ